MRRRTLTPIDTLARGPMAELVFGARCACGSGDDAARLRNTVPALRVSHPDGTEDRWLETRQCLICAAEMQIVGSGPSDRWAYAIPVGGTIVKAVTLEEAAHVAASHGVRAEMLGRWLEKQNEQTSLTVGEVAILRRVIARAKAEGWISVVEGTAALALVVLQAINILGSVA